MDKNKKNLENQTNKEKSKATLIYVILLIIGSGFLLYPTLSNYYNSFHQSKAISNYIESISNVDEDTIEKFLEEAYDYNNELKNKNSSRWKPTPKEHQKYLSTLAISDTGVIGYIEIPKINVELPIYHTVADDILQVAVGHVEGSSLPVGGESTHAVLSGHRGLPSAKLFTDLDKMEVGDVFYIRVLNEVLTYEVDQILIVEPNDISALEIEKKCDYCTLITCTPYGVNTHRMLVRGHRTETTKQQKLNIMADAVQIKPIMIAPIIGVPICFIYVIYLIIKPKKNKDEDDDEDDIDDFWGK